MSRHFTWDIQKATQGGFGNADLTDQQYLIGKNSIPGADLIRVSPTPPFDTADGPELDTLIELDPHACSFAAWVNLDRLPDPNADPFGQDISETFGIIARSVIIGGDLTPGVALQIVGDSPKPLLVMRVARVGSTAIGISTNTSGGLPITPKKWMFVCGSHVIDTGGPHLFYGELDVPVVEASYSGGDGFRFAGAGDPGLANPGLNSNGQWVDRWIYGPFLLGTRTLQVPPVTGPGQQYGLLGPNTTFGSLQGLLANVTMWNGALTLEQFEWLRQNRAVLGRPTPPPAGFPPLVANWALADDLLDYSGHGHHLQAVGAIVRAPQPAPPEIISPEELALASVDPKGYLQRRLNYVNSAP